MAVRKAARLINYSNKMWNSNKGYIRLGDMDISHLINSFHLLKERARSENCTALSDEKFCLEIFPEYEWLRNEIANRLREMKAGSIRRAYWHSKFSKRNLSDYSEIKALLNTDIDDVDFEHRDAYL